MLDKLGGIGGPVDIGKIRARMRRGDLDKGLRDARAGDLQADLDGLVIEPARAADHFGALQSLVEQFIGAAHGGEVLADGHLAAEGEMIDLIAQPGDGAGGRGADGGAVLAERRGAADRSRVRMATTGRIKSYSAVEDRG